MPEFVAYDFGPFSKDIYEQIELFQNLKFIKTDSVSTNDSTDELDDWETLYGEDIFDVELKDGYRKLNIDYNIVRELWTADPRIGQSHTFVYEDNRGFGGSCFPKDTQAIIYQAKECNSNVSLIESAVKKNSFYKTNK
jgi:UDPglucose 6-dehydrogenase